MQIMEHTGAHDRYAKCVEVSKRIRWDIDRDVIRGRKFDVSKKFLPDGLSKVDRLSFLDDDEKRLVSQIQGPHLRQHLRTRRALHRREDARNQPRALARRPDRARGASALHRRRIEAPGAVPPRRGDGGRRHACRLHLPAAAERRRQGRAQQVDVGRPRADLPHRALHASALPAEHRARRRALRALEGRVPVPLEGGVAARDSRRARMAARGREADAGRARWSP